MSAEQLAAWDDNEAIERLIRDEYGEHVATVAQAYPSERRDVVMDYGELYAADPDAAEALRDGDRMGEERVKTAILAVTPDTAFTDPRRDDSQRGDRLRVRVTNVSEPLSVSDMARRGDELVGRLTTLRGQVAKTTPVKPRLDEAVFVCPMCNAEHRVFQPLHGSNEGPSECRSGCAETPEPDTALSSTFRHQLVRVKHPPGQSDNDQHIDVHLTGHAAGMVTSGDNVDITGRLHDDFGEFERPIPDFWMDAHDVSRHQSDYEETDTDEYRDEIKRLAAGEEGDPYTLLQESIGAGIHGGERMDTIKLALGLQLFGGWRIEKPDGTAFRGDIHNIMVGAPGEGKSDLMESVTSISPRSTAVEGKNVSKKGLTAAAVKDDFAGDQWTIKAGAFVRGGGGVCAIDELDKVDNDAVESLHGALEKQRVEVSAAGKNTTLSCETALLAGANPDNEYFIDEESVISQLPVGHAMRQRMDGVWILRATPDAERDEQVVESMLQSIANSEDVTVADPDELEDKSPAVSTEVLRAWVAYARENCRPAFDLQAVMDTITDHYTTLRADSQGSDAPISARVVGSILRFTMASARVRLADTVTERDVDRAIGIVSSSLAQVGQIHADGATADPEIVDMVDSAKTNATESQDSRRDAIMTTLDSDTLTPAVVAEQTGLAEQTVLDELESLKTQGRVIEPEKGVFTTV